MLRLDCGDVDQEHAQLVVRRSKSGKSRRLPLCKTVLEALSEMELNDHGRVFGFGTQVSKTFAKAAQRAKLKGVTLHTCRHTFCSRLAARGVDLVTVQALAGHATIVTTMRYAHDVAAREAISLLDQGCTEVAHTRHTVLKFNKTQKVSAS